MLTANEVGMGWGEFWMLIVSNLILLLLFLDALLFSCVPCLKEANTNDLPTTHAKAQTKSIHWRLHCTNITLNASFGPYPSTCNKIRPSVHDKLPSFVVSGSECNSHMV